MSVYERMMHVHPYLATIATGNHEWDHDPVAWRLLGRVQLFETRQLEQPCEGLLSLIVGQGRLLAIFQVAQESQGQAAVERRMVEIVAIMPQALVARGFTVAAREQRLGLIEHLFDIVPDQTCIAGTTR